MWAVFKSQPWFYGDCCPFALLLKRFTYLFLFHVCECFACMHVCASCTYFVPAEVRRRHWIPWTWSYRCLWTTMWVLRPEPRFSSKTASTVFCAIGLRERKRSWVFSSFCTLFTERVAQWSGWPESFHLPLTEVKWNTCAIMHGILQQCKGSELCSSSSGAKHFTYSATSLPLVLTLS